MLKIRLSRLGKKHAPRYRIIVTPSTTKRDGKYIELLGTYNPEGKTDQEKFSINYSQLEQWQTKGAQVSDGLQKLLIAFPQKATKKKSTKTTKK